MSGYDCQWISVRVLVLGGLSLMMISYMYNDQLNNSRIKPTSSLHKIKLERHSRNTTLERQNNRIKTRKVLSLTRIKAKQANKTDTKEVKPEIPSISAELETSSKEQFMIDNYKPRSGHYCNVHDYSIDIDTSNNALYQCVQSRTRPPVQICIYPTYMDVYVSYYIWARGSWELNINNGILNALRHYPSAGFLDIGANLGMHSLVVAQSGRRVVAVEPKWSTIKRLQKSVKLNKLMDKVVIVKNAIYNERATLTLYSDNRNQGGSSLKSPLVHQENILTILFDDLLEVVKDQEVVIKMDIEGSECRALQNSTQFFSKIKVRAIFMEFMNLRKYLGGESMTTGKRCVFNMVTYLRGLGFVPRDLKTNFKFGGQAPLEDTAMRKWPNDIVWTRSQQEMNQALRK